MHTKFHLHFTIRLYAYSSDHLPASTLWHLFLPSLKPFPFHTTRLFPWTFPHTKTTSIHTNINILSHFLHFHVQSSTCTLIVDCFTLTLPPSLHMSIPSFLSSRSPSHHLLLATQPYTRACLAYLFWLLPFPWCCVNLVRPPHVIQTSPRLLTHLLDFHYPQPLTIPNHPNTTQHAIIYVLSSFLLPPFNNGLDIRHFIVLSTSLLWDLCQTHFSFTRSVVAWGSQPTKRIEGKGEEGRAHSIPL